MISYYLLHLVLISTAYVCSKDVPTLKIPLRLLDEVACPYAAAFIASKGLHLRIRHWLNVFKMEEVFFNTIGTSRFKLHFSNPQLFYVHHLSSYEHEIHDHEGIDVARKKTIELSKAARAGECQDFLASGDQQFIAFIPFYGGLPPNVTSDLKVRSVGEGNSLMDKEVKGLQLLATLCSALKLAGQAVIAVANTADLQYVDTLVCPY